MACPCSNTAAEGGRQRGGEGRTAACPCSGGAGAWRPAAVRGGRRRVEAGVVPDIEGAAELGSLTASIGSTLRCFFFFARM